MNREPNSEILSKSVALFGFYFKAKYRYSPKIGEKEKLSINSFEKALNRSGINIASVSDKFLENHTRFMFDYYSNKSLQRHIRFGWIFGKLALERSLKAFKNSSQMYAVNKNVAASTNKLFGQQLNQLNEEFFHQIEDQQRKKFHNSEQGFLNCIEHTTLWKKCATCYTCKYNKDCKVLLKLNYPDLYQKRINGKIIR